MLRLRYFLAACLLGLLAACGSDITLYSAATEPEANEILSVLLDAGIPAHKTATKEGMAVTVAATQVAQALDILRSRGLPRERFDGMGQIFRKEGLVSSPLEERARYIYALSQELANTLSQMDGVLAARVHVVLPERGSVGELASPSTAAVFIKHQQGYALDTLQPQIRKLVTHSIPGLSPENVSIALVAAQPSATQAQAKESSAVLGVLVDAGSVPRLMLLLAALLALVVLLAAAAGFLLWRQLRAPKSADQRREPAMNNPGGPSP